MFHFMTFYQFILKINFILFYHVFIYNFLSINLHVFLHVFMTFYQFFLIMFLNKRKKKIFIIYCAFSLNFSTNALSLRKLLLLTMCFLILFFDELDFLWKHAWVQFALTEKIFIIYYVLSHSISRRARWENFYYLLCVFSSNRTLRRAHCHWENLYYLVSVFSF